MHPSLLPWRGNSSTEAWLLNLPARVVATKEDFDLVGTKALRKPERHHDLDSAVDAAVRLRTLSNPYPWILVGDTLLTPDEVDEAYKFRYPNRV